MKNIFLLGLAFLFLTSSPSVMAEGFEGTYQIIIKKQEEKKRSRWSIYDWLETKKKFAMWDRWLAMNTSDVVFESYLGGRFYSGSTAIQDLFDNDPLQSLQGELGFYYRIFGIQGRYVDMEGLQKGYDGSLHLRLLGTGLQNFNFTLGYGLRHRQEAVLSNIAFNNQFIEGSLTLYIFSFFGIEGAYQHLFEDTQTSVTLSGNRWNAGAFFEFGFARVFLDMFEERLESTGTTTAGFGASGWNLGARLYF